MFGVLKKFFLFSGKENSHKFKSSIVISLIDALASALKIPAIMCVLMGVIEGKDLGKYILGSIAIMAVSIVVGILCKMSSTVLQTEGGYTTLRSLECDFRTANTSRVPSTAQMVAEVTARKTLFFRALNPFSFSVNSST